MRWFSISLRADSSRVFCSLITARIGSTMLDYWLLYPRYEVVWVVCYLLYEIWALVKWVLKLGHVWSAEGLVLERSEYLEKIPALVIIIFPC